MNSRAIAVGALVVAVVCGIGFVQRDQIRRWLDPQPWQVALCESILAVGLKAPSTYRRADIFVTPGAVTTDVMITFDAANSYGTPIRGTGICEKLPNNPDAIIGSVGDNGSISASVDGEAIDSVTVLTGALRYWNDRHR